MKIALLGDIALIESFDIENNPKLESSLERMSTYLSQFDAVIANLEAPFSIEKKRGGPKSAYLYSNPKNIKLLKYLHVGYVSLANNHMFDYGEEGYELTKSLLDKEGIKWFGCEGKNVQITDDSNKLMLEGFCCYSTNPINSTKYGGYGINELSVNGTVDILNRNKELGFFTIAAIHTGIEHVNYPSIEGINMARKFADVGSMLYYGHHPHVLQGYEMYNDCLISHSLGNFIFDDNGDKNIQVILSENNRTSAILELEVENNRVIHFQYVPIYIGKGVINIKEPDNHIVDQYNFSSAFTQTHKYIKDRNDSINSRISKMKAKRDIKWYLRRLNYRYVKLFLSNRYNSKAYRENILEQL